MGQVVNKSAMVVNVKNSGLCRVRFSCVYVTTFFFMCVVVKHVKKEGSGRVWSVIYSVGVL